MDDSQRAEIAWRDGVPVSARFNDPYFSLEDGLAETRHVFLAGNDLPQRFQPGFHIAELGFGTGLNLLAALLLWRTTGQAGPLRYTAFEAFPMSQADMAAALAAYPELPTDTLLAAWPNGRLSTEMLQLEVILGDARRTVPAWSGQADAWFLDGFAPAQNPEMWEPTLMRDVAARTRPGGTFATYTAAGAVRRALSEAGFEVNRIKGFGRKRHMSVGRLP